jgi:hypothetical protein
VLSRPLADSFAVGRRQKEKERKKLREKECLWNLGSGEISTDSSRIQRDCNDKMAQESDLSNGKVYEHCIFKFLYNHYKIPEQFLNYISNY